MTNDDSADYAGGVTSEGIRTSIECIVKDDDASTRAVVSVTTELVVPVVAIFLYGLFWLYKKLSRGDGMLFFLNRTLLCVFAVLYIGYISITRSLLQILNCITVDDSLDNKTESSTKYWAGSTNVECYTGSHAILAYFIGWPLLILFTVGFPVLLAILTTRYVKEEDYTDGWIYDIIGFLYRSYEREYIYWESVVMTKKAFLVVVVVFSYPLGVTLQVALAVFVLNLALYFQTACCPFREEFDDLDKLENVSQLVSLLTLLSSLFFMSERVSYTVRVLMTVVIVIFNAGFLVVCFIFLIFISSDHMKRVLRNEGIPCTYAGNPLYVFWIYMKNYKIKKLINKVVGTGHGPPVPPLSPQASDNMSVSLQATEKV